MAQARYWLCAASSLPIWLLSCSTKRGAATGSPGQAMRGSGSLRELLLGDLLAVHSHELALLDRIPRGQRAVLQHPQRTAAARGLRRAALQLRQLAYLRLVLGHARKASTGD